MTGAQVLEAIVEVSKSTAAHAWAVAPRCGVRDGRAIAKQIGQLEQAKLITVDRTGRHPIYAPTKRGIEVDELLAKQPRIKLAEEMALR